VLKYSVFCCLFVIGYLCADGGYKNFDEMLKVEGEIDKEDVSDYFNSYNIDENTLSKLIEKDINLKTKRDFRSDLILLNSLLKDKNSLIEQFSKKYKGVDFLKASFWLSYNRRIGSWVDGKTYFLYPTDIKNTNLQSATSLKETTKYFTTEFYDGVIEFEEIDGAVKYKITYRGITKYMEVPFFSLSYFNPSSDIAQGKNSSHRVTIEAIDNRGNVIKRINAVITVKVGNGYPAPGGAGGSTTSSNSNNSTSSSSGTSSTSISVSNSGVSVTTPAVSVNLP